jgi:hypothetical protein
MNVFLMLLGGSVGLHITFVCSLKYAIKIEKNFLNILFFK